ncbi:MAG: hypothetical protein ABI601_12020 [bacterium]
MHDDDEKFDDFLRHAASDYNAPTTPRADAIWSAIEPDVARAIAPRRRSWSARVLFVGAAAAATLVLGVGIGRWSSQPTVLVRAPASNSTASVSSNSQARALTLDHLADAEVFLTTVRYELESGLPDADRAARSRELLGRTRVLLGASQHRSPEVARLLQDLELLLAEISALPPGRSSLDRTILDESIRDGDVIPRIRATLPAHAAGA